MMSAVGAVVGVTVGCGCGCGAGCTGCHAEVGCGMTVGCGIMTPAGVGPPPITPASDAVPYAAAPAHVTGGSIGALPPLAMVPPMAPRCGRTRNRGMGRTT
jgi:hypothetical protein